MIAGAMLLAVPAFAQNTFEGHYTRPLGDVLNDISQRFNVRLKYNVILLGLNSAMPIPASALTP